MPGLMNGKKERAKSTKMTVEEKPKKAKPVEVEPEENETRLTLAKRLEPEMLNNPYPVDYPGLEDSAEFCLEKIYRTIVDPLGDAMPTEREWLDLARRAWQWRNQVEERNLRAAAKSMYARAQEDPRLWEMMVEYHEQNS